MIKNIHLEEISELIIDKLNAGGEVSFTPNGNSMLPCLIGNIDTITLKSIDRAIKVGDIVLYKNYLNKFILHRVIKVNKDKTFNIRGDNEIYAEKNIELTQIIGIVSHFTHKKKSHSISDFSYVFYYKFWNFIFPIRFIFKKLFH